MGRRELTNIHPNHDMQAILLLTDFMRAHGANTWDGDQSECEIIQAARTQVRLFDLSLHEATELVIHKILGDEGPASIIPDAAYLSGHNELVKPRPRPAKRSKIHALTV